MSKTIHTEILTPFGAAFKGDVVSATLPGTEGSFQVLHNHAALMSSLDTGLITVRDSSGMESLYSVSGGFAEVQGNHVSVLAEAAESKEQIDIERAEEAKRRAEERLGSRKPDVDVKRAEAALRRAINRLRLAGAR